MKNNLLIVSLLALFAFLTYAGYHIQPFANDYNSNLGAVLVSGDSLIVYDGETGSAPLLTGVRNCLSYAEEVSGGRAGVKSLLMKPDVWHSASYSVNCGGQDRLNFSPYSYLEFYIKGTKSSSKSHAFNVVSYFGRSNTVNLINYVEGGVIDTSWRLVSIPLSALKTTSYDLSTVDTLYFGADTDNSAYYVDDIAVRKTKTGTNTQTLATVSNTTSGASTIHIYDGEAGSAPLLAASCISYAEEVAGLGKDGAKGLKLKPDNYHSPQIKIICGGRDRVDMSSYAAIEFWIRGDSNDTNDAQFNVVSYYGTSKTVPIKKYTQGGIIDTTWRLVSIPIADLKTSTYNLSAVDDLYFGVDSKGRSLYIDNVEVVKTRTSAGTVVVTAPRTLRVAPVAAEKPTLIGSGPQAPQIITPTQPAVQTPVVTPERPVVQPVVTPNDPVVAELIKNIYDFLFNYEETETPVVPSTAATVQASVYDFDEVDLANHFGQWLYAENNKFISLNFVEKYDVDKVKNSGNYTIKSSDDPAYMQGRQPTVKGYRWRTIYVPTIRLTDLKVAYRIFLELPADLHNGKTYTVTVSNIGIATKPFTFTFNDKALNKNIKVNQVGYLPNSQKIAYVGQYMGTGGPMPFAINQFFIQDASGKQVYSGTPTFRNIDTNNTGEHVYELNFSALTTAGMYTVYIPKVGVSYPFRIGNDVYNEVLGNALSGAYHQRASTELTKEFTRFTHGRAHMNDAYVMNHNPIPDWFRSRFDSQGDTKKRDANGNRAYYGTSLSNQFINTAKGHYDAGDYGKYTINGALFIGNILVGFDAFPSHLMKDDLGVPESGNGISDILEEAKWELDWLENMQDSNDGGVFCIVKPDGAVEYYENRPMDAVSPGKRLLYAKDTTCTAHYAAALAKAGANELIKKHYPDAAARYIEKAKKSWTFLENNPGYLGWHHYGVKDEFDADKSMDERVWASVELYNATGEGKYLSFLQARHNPEFVRWGWHTLFEASGQANYACAFTKRGGMDGMKERCKTAIIKAADSHVKDSQNRAYRLSMSDAPLNYRDYTYFFPQERIMQLLIANSFNPNSQYTQTALYNWDYVLGANPTGYSYITGIGSKRFREIVSTQSVYDGIKSPVPGIPIGMGNNFGYLEVYGSKLAQMFPTNRGGSPDPKVSYPLLAQVYDGWNIGVEFTIPEIAQNIISAAYFGTKGDAKNKAPTGITIVADKLSGPVPLTVSFQASGTDNDGKVVRYHWDFDDESYSIRQNPTHTFADPYKVYKVVLTVTDNDGLQKFKEVEIRTTPKTFAFNAQPHINDVNTLALFNFDTSLSESTGKGYVFKNNGAQLSGSNLLWMQNPGGKAVEFDSVSDSIEVELPRKSVVPSANSTLVAEAKMYIDTYLSQNVADSKLFVLMQNDSRLIGLFDAKYLDGTHVKAMDGYERQQKLLTSERITALAKQGKMQTHTWYNFKLVITGGKAEVYVNNDKVAESSVSPQFASSDSPIKLIIGGFKGYVDEVRIGSR